MNKFLGICGIVASLAANMALAQERSVEFLQPNGQEQSFRGYLNGFSFWSKTVEGSAEITLPFRRDFAGGVGTYSNPITLAVGFKAQTNGPSLDFPAGTRFYLPHLRKYAIVEDTCVDITDMAQSPCQLGKDGLPWLQIYVDGLGVSQEAATACARKITSIQTFIMDPGPNFAVVVGELTQSGCFTFPDL